MNEQEIKGSLDNNTEAHHKGLSQALQSLLNKKEWSYIGDRAKGLTKPNLEVPHEEARE